MTFINAILFFLIALIYSSGGFGGGSMYLAILGNFGLPVEMVRFTGLSCNAIVTSNGTLNFMQSGWLDVKRTVPILLFSIPFCIWSATFKLADSEYYIALGICLLISGVFMLIRTKGIQNTDTSRNKWWLYPASSVIGFVAGITGIGGGVYLAPLLYFSKWGSAKQIAATTSVFILVNSVAALVTQYAMLDLTITFDMVVLLVAAALGGFIGSRLSSSVFGQKTVKYLTAGLIIFASVRILSKYL